MTTGRERDLTTPPLELVRVVIDPQPGGKPVWYFESVGLALEFINLGKTIRSIHVLGQGSGMVAGLRWRERIHEPPSPLGRLAVPPRTRGQDDSTASTADETGAGNAGDPRR